MTNDRYGAVVEAARNGVGFIPRPRLAWPADGSFVERRRASGAFAALDRRDSPDRVLDVVKDVPAQPDRPKTEATCADAIIFTEFGDKLRQTRPACPANVCTVA